MAFSSLNTFSASTGLGVSSKKTTTTTTYTSGLYYKGYANSLNIESAQYFYGVDGTTNNRGTTYSNALLFFANNTHTHDGTTTSITSATSYTGGVTIQHAVSFYGYFKPSESGNWRFRSGSATTSNDDIATIWIGSNIQTIDNLKSNASLSAYNASTNVNGYRLQHNYTSTIGIAFFQVALEVDKYYPILFNWGQSQGGQVLQLAFAKPSNNTTYITNGSGYYYNTGA